MKLISTFVLLLMLTACSSYTPYNQLGKQQTVETGVIVAINTFTIKPERIRSYGNVGVGVGSGGYRGIYGSVDVGTLARLFRNVTGPQKAHEIIVKKTNGETVAVTQLAKENFKAGDKVKILLRNGEAVVIH